MQAISANMLLKGLAPSAQLSDDDISLVTTDSRELQKGCIFVAFPGERFDGHDFVQAAVEAGAVYVVVNYAMPNIPPEKQIVCPNSYDAMTAMGTNYRAQFQPNMIGITGSVGKTTTKEFCYAVLSAFGTTIKTLGNQNNELGVPRTLFRLEDSTQYAVVEMGMNHAGEISRLTRCAQPTAGIITSVGTAHIENLGSRENILKAKLELCEGLPEGAPLALNYDDDYLRTAALPAHVKPVWFSIASQEADVYICDEKTTQTSEQFTLCDQAYGRFAVEIPALGRHSILDALAAYCAATRMGLDAQTCANALADFQQTGMRQKVVQHGDVTVIEDCYNANPDSMAAALRMFATYPCNKRVALLGDMLELGSHSAAAHHALGALAAHSGVDALITYGAASQQTAQAAKEAGIATVIHTQTHEDAAQMLQKVVSNGDAVLVKASRSMALEQALALFYEATKAQ